ncbi:uncharacterized protein [Dysidea avara]|uniref:uncharacterized protein isoform X2 n=1 Tax=Dysidea avara TaxID=196820 RepID=UPI0033169407
MTRDAGIQMTRDQIKKKAGRVMDRRVSTCHSQVAQDSFETLDEMNRSLSDEELPIFVDSFLEDNTLQIYDEPAGSEDEVNSSLDSLPLAPSSIVGMSPSVPIDDEPGPEDENEVNSSLDSLPLAPSTISGNSSSVDKAAHKNSKKKVTKTCSREPTKLPKYQAKRFAPLGSSTPSKKQREENNSSPSCEENNKDNVILPCSLLDDSGLIGIWNLSNVLNFNGCKEKCALKEHELTEYDALSYHCAFDSKTSVDQNEWLIQYFATHCPLTTDGLKDIKNIVYIVKGKIVCFKLWLEVLSVSMSRFYRLRRQFVEFGDTTNAVKQQRRRSLSPKTLEALTWMEHYFNKIGDKRPDKDAILLPTCLTEKRIHEILLDQLYHGDESKGICLSQFNKLYRQEFKNVSIPKQCRFSKCDFCILIKLESSKATTSSEERKRLEELLRDHISLQNQERQRYRKNQLEAAETPGGCLSLIIDGMDQNKTNIPSLVRVSKSCQNLWTLRTHLTGVVVHGLGHHCLFDYLQWPHDCNLTLTAILFILEEISTSRVLPSKLYVQMDNCVRENKDKFVYAFMSYLVEINIFSEIEIGFLMVGHTHEDVDQRFSQLSQYLSKRSATTMEDMLRSAKTSNPDVVHASVMEKVFDIRKWISPHIEVIKYHTEPHVFLFKRDASGKVVMQYKYWSHDEWIGNCVLLKSVPVGRPELVQPSLVKQDLGQLRRDIPKYELSGALSPEDKERWNRDISDIENRFGTTQECSGWTLDTMLPVNERSRPAPSDVTVSERVQKYAASHNRRRPIQIGKQPRSRKDNRTITMLEPLESGIATVQEDLYQPGSGCE